MTVLILAHPMDVHADAVQAHLSRLGVEVCRMDTAELGNAANPVTMEIFDGYFTGTFSDCDLGRVHCVWQRRPSRVVATFADDAAERTAALGVLTVLPHLNHPAAMAAAFKPAQLVVANQCGLKVPATMISSVRDRAQRFAKSFDDAVVVKALSRQAGGLVDELNRAGWLREMHMTQRRVPTAYFVRLTVVDEHHFAVRIDSPYLDWRRSPRSCVYTKLDRPMPASVTYGVSQLMRRLNLRYGAMNFAVDPRGQWWFLEINPNGQWLWLEHATGVPISCQIATALAY